MALQLQIDRLLLGQAIPLVGGFMGALVANIMIKAFAGGILPISSDPEMVRKRIWGNIVSDGAVSTAAASGILLSKQTAINFLGYGAGIFEALNILSIATQGDGYIPT